MIKRKTGEIIGNQKPVTIGDNVFIAWGATVLCGSTIESNVVIGAHSVVNGHIRGDSVYAGIPARRICSLSEYREKRMSVQVEEAKQYVRLFRERLHRDPEQEEIPEYFFLFADPDALNDKYRAQMRLMGNFDESLAALKNQRRFESYADFLRNC